VELIGDRRMTLSINGKTYEAGELIAYVKKLEKENAELKEESDFFHREKGEYKSAFLQEVRKTIKLNKQLTKAKEIIRQFLNDYPVITKELLDKLEQFIKEK
jgi:hypothetical protein